MVKSINKREMIHEGIFIICCSAISLALGYYTALTVLPLLLLTLVFRIPSREAIAIPSCKTLALAFLIPYLLILLQGIMTALKVYKSLDISADNIKIAVKILALAFSLVLIKLSGFSLSKFNWSVTRKQLFFTLAVGSIIAVAFLLLDGSKFAGKFNYSIPDYFLYILRITVLTAFFEELLCRGVLLSWLKGIGLSESKANMLQAFIFGVVHMFNYLGSGVIIAFLITSSHILIGYFFGKLYLKTKTLIPGIIIHIIWDII